MIGEDVAVQLSGNQVETFQPIFEAGSLTVIGHKFIKHVTLFELFFIPKTEEYSKIKHPFPVPSILKYRVR